MKFNLEPSFNLRSLFTNFTFRLSLRYLQTTLVSNLLSLHTYVQYFVDDSLNFKKEVSNTIEEQISESKQNVESTVSVSATLKKIPAQSE